jgi:hypothetical protein
MIRRTGIPIRFSLLVSLWLAAVPPAFATTATVNFSDLWWNPAEAGWGATIAQQADVMFIAFFVYGDARQPTWVTATLSRQGTLADGSVVFEGDLYQTSGPSFDGPFDPSSVVYRKAGTATFRSATGTTATLTYSVNGTVVTKAIERQTLRNDNLSGSYIGGNSDVTSDCLVPSNDGFVSEESGAYSITHAGSLVTLSSPRCTYVGTYHQDGQSGRVDGTYTCDAGAAAGTMTFFDLRTEQQGVLGRYMGRGSNCTFDGHIGLARRK